MMTNPNGPVTPRTGAPIPKHALQPDEHSAALDEARKRLRDLQDRQEAEGIGRRVGEGDNASPEARAASGVETSEAEKALVKSIDAHAPTGTRAHARELERAYAEDGSHTEVFGDATIGNGADLRELAAFGGNRQWADSWADCQYACVAHQSDRPEMWDGVTRANLLQLALIPINYALNPLQKTGGRNPTPVFPLDLTLKPMYPPACGGHGTRMGHYNDANKFGILHSQATVIVERWFETLRMRPVDHGWTNRVVLIGWNVGETISYMKDMLGVYTYHSMFHRYSIDLHALLCLYQQRREVRGDHITGDPHNEFGIIQRLGMGGGYDPATWYLAPTITKAVAYQKMWQFLANIDIL